MNSRIGPLFPLVFCLGCAPQSRAAIITWTNTAGGFWANMVNWSPNQVPGTNDDVYITMPGTYSVTGNVVNLNIDSLTIGGSGSGVQALRPLPNSIATTVNVDTGGVIIGDLYATAANINTGGLLSSPGALYLTNANVNSGGVLEVDANLYGAVSVGNGGVLQAGNSLGSSSVMLDAQVTVNSGGQLRGRLNSFFLDDGTPSATTRWLTVQSGGLVNLSVAGIESLSAVTNAGIINLTNCAVWLDELGPVHLGGLVNQPGGVINLWGTSSFGTMPGPLDGPYLINQGTMNFASGSGQISLRNFDLSQGTITAQPGFGTLQIGQFTLSGPGSARSLVGTYNAAAGSTIQFLADSAIPGVSPGTPLTLGGAGQYQFSGAMYLPLNPVPGLQLIGGFLTLGPDFQGGTITNLSLDGIWLMPTTNVITGVVAATNSILGALTIAKGGLLLLVNGRSSASQITVDRGGELLAMGSMSYLNPLAVQSGGLTALVASNLLSLWPITNAGTINMTNCSLLFYDPSIPGSPNGALVNQAGGAINLWQGSSLYGPYAGEYLINQGVIDSPDPAGHCSLSLSNIANQGLISVEHGTLILQSPNLNLRPSGTLRVGLSSASDYGRFSIDTGGTGPTALGGLLAIFLNDGYLPGAGSTFPLVSYGALSRNFSGFSYAPAGVVWEASYGGTSLNLAVQPAMTLAGANLTLNVNGAPGQQAVALTSSDLTLPRGAWTPVATNIFDASGFLSFTWSVNPAVSRAFFNFELR